MTRMELAAYGVFLEARVERDHKTALFAKALRNAVAKFGEVEYMVYPKGMGVFCNHTKKINRNEFVSEYLGEIYPSWRWFEKQDAIKNLYKTRNKPVLLDFYNLMFERPKDDPAGYDVMFIDPILKGNFASRLSHSCKPNCVTTVMSTNGRLTVGMYALRDIYPGEELTFDYHCVTEDATEQRDATCLCGGRTCRGSYLYFSGSKSFSQVMSERHTISERSALILLAGLHTSEQELAQDQKICHEHSIRSSVLDGLPRWAVRFTALVLRFIDDEMERMPAELAKWAVENDRIYSEADIKCEVLGVRENRLQNLVIALVFF